MLKQFARNIQIFLKIINKYVRIPLFQSIATLKLDSRFDRKNSTEAFARNLLANFFHDNNRLIVEARRIITNQLLLQRCLLDLFSYSW